MTYNSPSIFRLEPWDPLEMRIPIENYISDDTEKETYKQLTKIDINKENQSYTCFCKCYMLFISDREIDCAKSQVLRAFKGVNSVKKFV